MKQEITACALLHRDGRLFIAKRAKTKKFLPGKFELPGGHIEPGETLADGLRREFQEEFGVDITVGDPVYAFTYVHGNSHVVEIDFLTELVDPKTDVTVRPEEHSEGRWVTMAEVETFWSKDDAEYPAIMKGFQALNQRS